MGEGRAITTKKKKDFTSNEVKKSNNKINSIIATRRNKYHSSERVKWKRSKLKSKNVAKKDPMAERCAGDGKIKWTKSPG